MAKMKAREKAEFYRVIAELIVSCESQVEWLYTTKYNDETGEAETDENGEEIKYVPEYNMERKKAYEQVIAMLNDL